MLKRNDKMKKIAYSIASILTVVIGFLTMWRIIIPFLKDNF